MAEAEFTTGFVNRSIALVYSTLISQLPTLRAVSECIVGVSGRFVVSAHHTALKCVAAWFSYIHLLIHQKW